MCSSDLLVRFFEWCLTSMLAELMHKYCLGADVRRDGREVVSLCVPLHLFRRSWDRDVHSYTSVAVNIARTCPFDAALRFVG